MEKRLSSEVQSGRNRTEHGKWRFLCFIIFFFITLLLSLNETLKILNLRLDGKEIECLF